MNSLRRKRIERKLHLAYFLDWPPITQLGWCPEAESREKHGGWDPIPEVTFTSPYFHSRVDSNTFFMGNSKPESTSTLYMPKSTLSPIQGLWIWPQIMVTLSYYSCVAGTGLQRFLSNIPKWKLYLKDCYAKYLLIYLLVLSCNVLHPNLGFLLQCLLLIPQNRTAVQ